MVRCLYVCLNLSKLVFVCVCIYVYEKGVHVFSMLFKFGVLLSVSASLDISFGNVPL